MGLRNKVLEADSLHELLDIVDIVYVTRLQRERFADQVDYERLKGKFVIDRKLLSQLSDVPFILHPLPRNEEIHPDVDDMPCAKYVYQMYCGLLMSQAIISKVCGE